MAVRTKERLNKISWLIHLSLITSEIVFCNNFNRPGCHGTNEVCKNCSCSDNNTKVNCSYRQLTEIPHSLPRNLRELDLRRNHLISLKNNSFENCINLYYLNLSTNSISHIHPSSFNNTPITHLHLEKNKLTLTHFPNILSPLRNTLNTLFIHKNHNISHLVFNNLHKLEELHLRGILFDGFGKSFSTLRSLKILRLYPDVGNLTNSTFMHFENLTLKKLNLMGAGVSQIEIGAFTPLKALSSLDLSYNYRLEFSFVEGSLNGLSDNLEELILTNLFTKENNRNVKVDETFFRMLSKKKKLKKLKLDKNRITDIPNNFVKYVRSLNHLDISKNRLSNALFWPFSIFLLTNLTYLNFDDQDVEPCPHDRLQEPEINYSQGHCKAVVIKHIPPCKFPKRNKNSLWCGFCPQNLKEFHFSNFIKKKNFNLPPVIVFGKCQITRYFFRNNGLKMALGPMVIFRPVSDQLVTIDLGYNNMKCFAPDILKFAIERGLTVVNTFSRDRLILDGNDLSNQLQHDHNGETFAVYSKLTELNLANNRLKMLNKLTFSSLTNLQILNLSSNYLTHLSIDMSHMRNLSQLDLTYNRLMTFDYSDMLTFSSLSSEGGYGKLILYIEENDFICSCFYLSFMEWVAKNDTYIENEKSITCKYLDASLKLTEIKNNLQTARRLCFYTLSFDLIISGLLVVLIICTTIGTIVYKYRWDIRYCIITLSQKKRQYQILLDQNIDYFYDAFVSYDMDDRSWIVHELLLNLEQKPSFVLMKPSSGCSSTQVDKNNILGIGCEENEIPTSSRSNYGTLSKTIADLSAPTESIPFNDGLSTDEENEITFKLCIHERDFEIGNEIETNIWNAIQNSRMVILIVTNQFIKSKWCRLEVEMAKMESLERGKNIVVAVFLEPIQETLESLEWFMKRYTYLEWFTCDTKGKKDQFWKRLKLALEGKNKKIVCQCGGKRLLDE